MKNMRLHFGIVLAFFVTTFILGSIFDYQVAQGIFSNKNTFGLIISVLGTVPGYACLAVCGGGLLFLGVSKKYNKVATVFLFIFAVVAYGCAVYFAGKEFFGPNGFTNNKIYFLGFLVVVPVMALAMLFGFKIAKKSDNPKLLILYIVIMAAIFLALVPGVTVIKSIFHRPRFRTLSDPNYPDIVFHNWWQRCANYKDLMSQYGLTSEEFKSFPSGHAGTAMVFGLTVAFVPLFNSKYAKLQLPLFYTGVAWTLLVAFARMRVGAHFLSDVSMGALITLIFGFIANEVIIHIYGRPKEEPAGDA